MIKFPTRLKELRYSKELSQQKLADKIGISKSSINMYERGEREPSFSTLEIIADFFNVDIDFLLGKTDIKNRFIMGWEELDHNKIYIAEEINSPQLKTYKIQIYNDADRNIFATDLPKDKCLLIGRGNVKELTPAEHTVLDNVLNAMESEDK